MTTEKDKSIEIPRNSAHCTNGKKTSAGVVDNYHNTCHNNDNHYNKHYHDTTTTARIQPAASKRKRPIKDKVERVFSIDPT